MYTLYHRDTKIRGQLTSLDSYNNNIMQFLFCIEYEFELKKTVTSLGVDRCVTFIFIPLIIVTGCSNYFIHLSVIKVFRSYVFIVVNICYCVEYKHFTTNIWASLSLGATSFWQLQKPSKNGILHMQCVASFVNCS